LQELISFLALDTPSSFPNAVSAEFVLGRDRLYGSDYRRLILSHDWVA
jgi:hypothetical protein